MFKNCVRTQKKFYKYLAPTSSLWVENNTFPSTRLGEESLLFEKGTSSTGYYASISSCEQE